MTFNDLLREVTSLGFEELTVEPTVIASFANLALSRIFSERRISKEGRLYLKDATPSVLIENKPRSRGERITYTTELPSLFLALCGEGSFTISDEGGIRTREFCSELTVFKERLEGRATLSFEGEYDYVIVTLALFSEVFGSDNELIPDPVTERRIDLRERIADLREVLTHPTDTRGRRVGTLESGSVLIIPRSYAGELRVKYLRSPLRISAQLPSTPIDIPEDSEELLSVLTTAYALLECDPELASYYEREYKERLAALSRADHSRDDRYLDVLGW